MRLTNGELSVNVMEVLNTVQGVAALAEKLPQVSVDFAGDPIAENEIQTIISEMDRARLQWAEENIEDLCPKCGAKLSVTRTKRWLILDKVSYRCASCGFATDSQENYDMLVAERVANTKGIAVSKFLGLAGTLLKKIASHIEMGALGLRCAPTDSVVLKDGEQVLVSIPAVLLTERAVRQTHTRQTSDPSRIYVGGSFRIAKGAYLKLGRSAAQRRQSESISSSISELFPRDYGVFVLTNIRVLFVGERLAATSFDLSQLVSISITEIEDQKEAIMFQLSNKQRLVMIMLQHLAFHPAGVPWPLFYPTLGLGAQQIVARVKLLARRLS